MAGNFIIRKATIDDALAIAKVHTSSWKESYVGMIDQVVLDNISIEKWLPSIEQMLKVEPELRMRLVAELAGEVVGICYAGNYKDNDTTGLIKALYLSNDAKNKGIGTALLKEAIAFLKSKKLSPILTEVLKVNYPARKFYEKQGGEFIKELQLQIGDKFYDVIQYGFKSR
jgi:ribosomal protein S18 acetylase RimI-like enzyme